MRRIALFALLTLPLLHCPSSEASPAEGLQRAVAAVTSAFDPSVRLTFRMTARVRLLLFWVGADDVGGGYVHYGKTMGFHDADVIQLVFGSDPRKAPRSINRWGTATEVRRRFDGHTESAFLGLMKSAKGGSVGAMREELQREASSGEHSFEGQVSWTGQQTTQSSVLRFRTSTDLDFNDREEAVARLLDVFSRSHRSTETAASPGSCAGASGFLFSIQDAAREAFAGRTVPAARCYVYNSKPFNLSVQSTRALPPGDGNARHVPGLRRVIAMRFKAINLSTGNESRFDIVFAADGDGRILPVRIAYQPNWWFQTILDLDRADVNTDTFTKK